MNDLNSIPFTLAEERPVTALACHEVACEHCGMFGLCQEAGLARDMPLLQKVVSRRTALGPGERLFRAAEPFYALYAVKSGSLVAVVDDGQGHHQNLGFYFPGDVLGLDAIKGGYYRQTVIGLEKSRICRLDYRNVSLLGDNLGAFYRQLVDVMSEQLMYERWHSVLLGAHSTEQRVASFLLSLSSRLHGRGLPHREFRLPMTRRDIADYLGLAMETVSRTLSSLQQQGLLVMRGRNTHLRDPERLFEIAALKLESAGTGLPAWPG